MDLFMPERVFFEQGALDYPLGSHIKEKVTQLGIDWSYIPSHNRVTGIPGKTPAESYRSAKKTLVVGVKKDLNFETCKPSAHYQFPLATGCPGHCQYCYLQTTLGKKPYLRVYVNVDEIHKAVQKHIQKHLPEITVFEGASSSDPVAVEHLTGSLKKTIEFFGQESHGLYRFVTKYSNVDSLLDAQHNGHTRFRFSINSPYVIKNFEHGTPNLRERLEAAGKVARAHYPLGFILAPLMRYEGWQEEYQKLFIELEKTLTPEAVADLTFELIMFRFTTSSKKLILERFPNTKLDLDETTRAYKFGKYGRGKYIYPKEEAGELREFIEELIKTHFPAATINYFT